MSISSNFYVIVWALILSLAAASVPDESSVRVRPQPGASEEDVFQAIRREIVVAAVRKRAYTNSTTFKNSTTLDASWDGAVLLKFGAEQKSKTNISVSEGVEIVCTTCYIKGVAAAELSIDGNFSASQLIDHTIDQVRGDIENLTTDVDEYISSYFHKMENDLEAHRFHLDDLELPTLNCSLSMDIPTIPQARLSFRFDRMELYMLIDTTLSMGATYNLPLYKSETVLGVSVTESLEVGIIFTIDLILSVEGEIDISSGFHIKLEDGLAIDIALFSNDVSDIHFNGGRFEFLPVTIESAGVVFKAVLRLGVHAGVEVITPDFSGISIANHSIPSIGGGIEVGVFANVAELVTNVTVAPEDEDCQLGVVQSYQLALGASAGATIAFSTHTWGPVPQTSVPIWYTELSACAIQGSSRTTTTPTITATPKAARRQDMVTTTLYTPVTYTGVNCLSSGLVNCPASLQNTSQSTETKTLVTVVPYGTDDDDLSVPASAPNTVPITVAFGSNAVSLPATTGSPVSYVPPPPSPTVKPEGQPSVTSEVEGVSKGVILGLSVGLGVPVLLALVAGFLLVQKRRRYSAVPKGEGVLMVAEPYGGYGGQADYYDMSRKAAVDVTETRLSSGS